MEKLEEKEIRRYAEEVLESYPELFLVDVKVKGNVGNQKVLVFIDGDNGISIDSCSQVSRQLGSFIEEAELFQGKYTLEVSSPGLDYPLTMPRQYVKNVGREVIVDLLTEDKIEGKLQGVDQEAIEIESNEETISIALKDMKQIKVKVSFK